MKIITLTTDLGGKDFYVGQMEGVILSLNSRVRIVNINQEIEAHNVFQGAFVLAQTWQYFPKGTVHLGVVDPGVGSSRRGIIIKTERCVFIGPDNGLFSLALKDQKVRKIIEINEKKVKKITETKISKTFHGRDVFAPVAGLISKGYEVENFGKEIRRLERLNLEKNEIEYIDHFGNIITSIPDTISKKFKRSQKVSLKYKNKKIVTRFVKTFSEGKKGEFLLLVGSHGFLELDLKEESAAKKLKAKVGDKIRVLR